MIVPLGILLQLTASGATPTCNLCHAKETVAFPGSQMTRAISRASDSAFLRDHADLTFRAGKYTWSIRTRAGISTYAVSDGQRVLSAPVTWAFGAGVVAQTYIAEREGNLYELPVSFYPSIAKVDWTLGHDALPRATIEEAFGRKIDAAEARRCFGCHSTGAVWKSGSEPVSLVPGVQCGQCHQHSEEHGASSGRGTASPMQRLSTLDSEQLGAVCARCHPSWEETTAKGPHSVLNVRVQLYRLTNSRCYDSDDRRISCTACHNPHEALVTDISHYDAKCRQCHGESANDGTRTAKRCRVSGTECVKCHMPKIEIPTLHYSFTDHQIRIQRADGRYPE
jgi:hypothetical protein